MMELNKLTFKKIKISDDILEKQILLKALPFFNIVCVTKNPAIIKNTEIIKDDNIIKEIKEIIKCLLEPHRILIKQNLNNKNLIIRDEIDVEKTIICNESIKNVIIKTLNECFLKSLKKHNYTDEKNIKLHKNYLFKKIFFKKNINIILEEIKKIKDVKWVLVPIDICEKVKKLKNFKINENVDENDENLDTIYLYGHIDDIVIYTNKNLKSDEIYAGKSNSVTLIINKNIKLKKFNGGFYEEGIKMIIEFLFINKNITKINLI